MKTFFAEFSSEREMFQTEDVEKMKIYLVSNSFFFKKKNLVICEIIWKIVAEPDRPQMTI